MKSHSGGEVPVWIAKEQIISFFIKLRILGESEVFTGEGMWACCDLRGDLGSVKSFSNRIGLTQSDM